MVVNDEQASIDGFEGIALAADRFHLNKFTSHTDTNYIRVSSRLEIMIGDTPRRTRARLNRKFSNCAVICKILLTVFCQFDHYQRIMKVRPTCLLKFY